MFGFIRSIKTFSKVPGVGMNVWPMFFIYRFLLSFIQTKGLLGVQSIVVTSLQRVLAILAIKMADF